MESDILRQHSLALSPWPSKNPLNPTISKTYSFQFEDRVFILRRKVFILRPKVFLLRRKVCGIGLSGIFLSTTWRFDFVYLSYLSTETHRYNSYRIRNTIQTLVAEEMYNGLPFPRAKQYKTIHDEWAATYLLHEQT